MMNIVKKIIYIVSDINKAISFEWIASALSLKFDLSFILIGQPKSELSRFLIKKKIEVYEIDNILAFRWLGQWLKIFFILKKEKPAIIHTHLWRANLLGLSTAWLLRIKRRIYTRHHAMVHYDEFPSGRKWDILCNALATDIIAISKNVEEILITKDKAKREKIRLIHHGFDVRYFQEVSEARIQALKTNYKLSAEDFPVIGLISRYVEWKGIQYIIPAFVRIRKKYPKAKLILANANGNYARSIKELLSDLPSSSYLEIKFEEDVSTLYHLFQIFVHVPTDPYVEAFGQTYIEPLLAGVPAVFTLSGVAKEFVTHRENSLVVDFKNSEQIEKAIIELMENEKLKKDLIRKGKTVADNFSLEHFILELEKLYSET